MVQITSEHLKRILQAGEDASYESNNARYAIAAMDTELHKIIEEEGE